MTTPKKPKNPKKAKSWNKTPQAKVEMGLMKVAKVDERCTCEEWGYPGRCSPMNGSSTEFQVYRSVLLRWQGGYLGFMGHGEIGGV